jgi:hypothetical protein
MTGRPGTAQEEADAALAQSSGGSPEPPVPTGISVAPEPDFGPLAALDRGDYMGVANRTPGPDFSAKADSERR